MSKSDQKRREREILRQKKKEDLIHKKYRENKLKK